MFGKVLESEKENGFEFYGLCCLFYKLDIIQLIAKKIIENFDKVRVLLG